MPHLILFFSTGVSLQTWAQVGMLDRELALYRKYVEHGWKVSVVTYGGKEDLELKERLKGINIICNRWNFPIKLYIKYLPFLYASIFESADVIKSNQLKGAEVACKVASYWNKIFVFRSGFLWTSLSKERSFTETPASEDTNKSRHIEREIFPQAHKIIVTTEVMRRYVIDTYSIRGEKVSVIPNFVQTDIFRPDETKIKFPKISCVARFSEQKNLFNLIQACKDNKIALDLIGSGPLESKLIDFGRDINAEVNFLGNVPNGDIPGIINSSSAFALPSMFEGNPKALLEAMSCGLPVIGSDVPGIREIIKHKDNGYLCGTDIDSIRSAIACVMGDENLREKLGRNARNFVEENYSLDKVFEEEYQLINQCLFEFSQTNKITHTVFYKFTSFCRKSIISLYILFQILLFNGKKYIKRWIGSCSKYLRSISPKPGN
jgi:glycosyltransferase involved in cell wall biosynthesis